MWRRCTSDSDSQTNRNVEMATLLERWGAAGPGRTDIIAGDINQDTIKGSLAKKLERAGFVDVLASLGNREQTHPWLDTYYMSDKWGVIDHILVRGATPIFGRRDRLRRLVDRGRDRPHRSELRGLWFRPLPGGRRDPSVTEPEG